jgi:hypothetical protein
MAALRAPKRVSRNVVALAAFAVRTRIPFTTLGHPMKLFTCPHCRARLYFENAQCLACGSTVLFDPEDAEFRLAGESVFACANAGECACNWRAADESRFCRACELNRTIPDLSVEGNRRRWIRVEAAKRRAIYSLLAFGLPVGPKRQPQDEVGLAFDFLGDPIGAGPGGERILTGHDNGLITLNVAEADSVERERRRVEMGEVYRTILGHFRHELGHYYWDRLIRDDPAWLERFRGLFGDETQDYAEALQRHYSEGPPPDWEQRHISAYAASHPWEDWAESWAHYLHISDTLEMVEALDFPLDRLRSAEGGSEGEAEGGAPEDAPAVDGGFPSLLGRWLVLSEASNSINRCMGLPDLYPFVISPGAASRLRFVHDLLRAERPSDVTLR